MENEGGCPNTKALAHPHDVYRSNLWRSTRLLFQRLDAAGGTTTYERERTHRLIRILGILLKGKLGAQRPLAAIVAFSNVPVAAALDEAETQFPMPYYFEFLKGRAADRGTYC
jgi:hypothetical protein